MLANRCDADVSDRVGPQSPMRLDGEPVLKEPLHFGSILVPELGRIAVQERPKNSNLALRPIHKLSHVPSIRTSGSLLS